MKAWPWLVGGVVALAAGVFTMGSDTGSAQWIVGLVIVIVGVALLVRGFVLSRQRGQSG